MIQIMRVGGVHIESGIVYLAVIDPSDLGLGTPVLVAQPKLTPNPDLIDAEALEDLTGRVRQELDGAGVRAVGLVGTRAFKGLQYKNVYSRVFGMCAVMAACTRLGLKYETLKTEIIGTTVQCPAKALEKIDPGAFQFDRPPVYWKAGLAQAYAAAATMCARAGS